MRKIPTVFQRDPEDRAHVLPSVNPGCEWVLDGEGTPTVKIDGTCVMLAASGDWWARREVKPGKNPPPNWVEADADETTGKRVGWEPVDQSSFAKAHAEALEHPAVRLPGTYELCGPKVNGNPHGYERHTLERHGVIEQLGVPRDFEGMRAFLLDALPAGDRGYIEGIVWHHPDGRMAKLKIRDFA